MCCLETAANGNAIVELKCMNAEAIASNKDLGDPSFSVLHHGAFVGTYEMVDADPKLSDDQDNRDYRKI